MSSPIPGSNPERESAADTPGCGRLDDHVKDAIDRFLKILERMPSKPPSKGLSTGLSHLDEICHGLEPGRIYLIASRPSLGKTALLMSIIAEVCLNQKTPALFFSGDLAIPQIVESLIFNRASAPLSAFDSGNLPNKSGLLRIQKCARELAESGLVLDDGRDMTIEAISARAREERTKAGIGLIAIDHLHLIRSESTHPGTSRKREMNAVVRELRNLARELALPILVSAHLKRRAEGRLPRCSDIRESGAIEYEADFIGLLHREGMSAEGCFFELLVAKNNNGPLGHVRLCLIRDLQRFEEFSEGEEIPEDEQEMIQAWRDYRKEKDFPREMA